jgi:hypothetical protein
LKVLFLVSWVDKGGTVLQTLNDVYRALLWESSVMLTFCTDSAIATGVPAYIKGDIDALLERGKLMLLDQPNADAPTATTESATAPTDTPQPAAESAPNQTPAKSKPSPVVVKQLKPLIALSSR